MHIRSYWGAGPLPDGGTAEGVMIEKADPRPKGARAGGRQAMATAASKRKIRWRTK